MSQRVEDDLNARAQRLRFVRSAPLSGVGGESGNQSVQMYPFVAIEAQGGGYRVDDLGRDAGGGTALESDVVLGADSGQHRDLFSSQSFHPSAGSEGRQPSIAGRDVRATSGEELAQG